MGRAAFQVSAGSEYLLAYQRVVGGNEHERRALPVGRTGYLLRVVLLQAAFNAFAGWIPAWLLSVVLYYVIGRLALLPLHMSVKVVLLSLGLTLGMCLISAVLAVRRVIKADPAEVF